MPKAKTSDDVWRKRKDAHQLHHKIADFIIHHDERDAPVKLQNLVKKYRAMMAEADAMQVAE